MPASVPRPPFARARIIGSGDLPLRLAAAVGARAAAIAEWAGGPSSEAAPSQAEAAEVDLVLWADGVPDPESILRASEAHPRALVVILAASLLDAASAGTRALTRAPGRFLVASHPLVRGLRSAEEPVDEDFVGVAVAVAPISGAPDAALAAAERFWLLLGAIPVIVTALEHDRRVALTEWLPQMSAAALARLGARSIARGAPEELLVGPAFLAATSVLCEDAGPLADSAVRHADLVAPLARALAREMNGVADLLEAPGDPRALASWMAEGRGFRRRFSDS